eukprot:3691068-Pleurochrysis_carterae.AAC.3
MHRQRRVCHHFCMLRQRRVSRHLCMLRQSRVSTGLGVEPSLSLATSRPMRFTCDSKTVKGAWSERDRQRSCFARGKEIEGNVDARLEK